MTVVSCLPFIVFEDNGCVDTQIEIAVLRSPLNMFKSFGLKRPALSEGFPNLASVAL